MIISRTPLRVSFAGGGSDLAAFYKEEPGAVVSTSINKYIYITTNRKFDDEVRASYSTTEIVKRSEDLKHGLIREALRLVGIEGGIEITSISDIPSSGTGLGSSSTYTVGLLNALYGYLDRHVGPERLAREACGIEIERLGQPIGKQDQYAAAYGGLQFYQFNPDGSVFVDPIICGAETKRNLEDNLMMFFTGMTRSADTILKEQRDRTTYEAGHRTLLGQLRDQAFETRRALEENSLDDIGEILDEAWQRKKQLAAGISDARIDGWYSTAKSMGASGGKILGAGGGGFLLLYARTEHQDGIRKALDPLRQVNFQLEPQGSKIIFVEEPPH